METEKTYLISPVFIPRNRKEVREFLREREKLRNGMFVDIVSLFIDDISDESINEEYPDIYKFYLDQFQKTCLIAEQMMKLKYWKINHYYLEQIAKPIENAYT